MIHKLLRPRSAVAFVRNGATLPLGGRQGFGKRPLVLGDLRPQGAQLGQVGVLMRPNLCALLLFLLELLAVLLHKVLLEVLLLDHLLQSGLRLLGLATTSPAKHLCR